VRIAFLVQPATDIRVRSLGMLALVCSYVREQQAQPLGGPFLRRTGPAPSEKDARQVGRQLAPVAKASMVQAKGLHTI
jgi:hypothetical protein